MVDSRQCLPEGEFLKGRFANGHGFMDHPCKIGEQYIQRLRIIELPFVSDYQYIDVHLG